MALYPRMFGLERPRIPVDLYSRMVRQFKLAAITRAQIVTAFALTNGEATTHDELMASLVPWTTIEDNLYIAHSFTMRQRLNITEASLKARIGVS